MSTSRFAERPTPSFSSRLPAAPSTLFAIVVTQALLVFGCASDSAGSDRRPSTAGASSNGTAGAGAIPGGAAATGRCAQLNQTQPCSCSDGMAGRQVCNTQWGACECAAADGLLIPNFEGNRRSDITFAWERTATNADLGGCYPGEYEGTFGGLYWSYLATLAPIEDLFVPVANISLPGEPSGFKFTIEPAEGGETVLRIRGRMDGIADGVFPFKSELEGELDCATKTFSARIIGGMYSILLDGFLPQSFEGVMWGTYDTRTHTIVDGEWDVMETTGVPPGRLAPMLPREFARDGFGGYGTWAAALPTDQSDPTIGQCPANFSCGPAQFGPNKLLCNAPLLGPPGCITDADCETQLPGRGVTCLKATAFSNCFLECTP